MPLLNILGYPTIYETFAILPELLLVLFGCAALVLDVLLPRERKELTAYFCLAGIGTALLALWQVFETNRIRLPFTVFYGMIAVDGFSLTLRLVALVAAALAIAMAVKYLDVEEEQHGEYYALILFATSGMMFLSSGVDFITLYVGLELMALSVYVLVGYLKWNVQFHEKRGEKSSEAALKYFLMGAFSSAILLFGFSIIFGLTGTTNVEQVAGLLPGLFKANMLTTTGDARLMAIMGIALVAAGLFFKIAAVPFHMWAPDAYEGAPTSVTAFMSVGPKAASYAMLARIFLVAFAPLRVTGDPQIPGWAVMFGVVAALTMTVGNVAAVTQQNAKRLMAYSSISHAGFILLGFVAGNEMGYAGAVFYLMAYTVMNLGAFGVLLSLRSEERVGDKLDDLNGLYQKQPALALMMLVCLLSLAGIPGTGGFMGKFYLFGGLIQAGNKWMNILAVVAALNVVISLYYYARFIKAMFTGKEKEEAPVTLSPPLHATIVLTVILVLVMGLYPQPFSQLSRFAVERLGPPTPPQAAQK